MFSMQAVYNRGMNVPGQFGLQIRLACCWYDDPPLLRQNQVNGLIQCPHLDLLLMVHIIPHPFLNLKGSFTAGDRLAKLGYNPSSKGIVQNKNEYR
jgi:hypothetical protein